MIAGQVRRAYRTIFKLETELRTATNAVGNALMTAAEAALWPAKAPLNDHTTKVEGAESTAERGQYKSYGDSGCQATFLALVVRFDGTTQLFDFRAEQALHGA